MLCEVEEGGAEGKSALQQVPVGSDHMLVVDVHQHTLGLRLVAVKQVVNLHGQSHGGDGLVAEALLVGYHQSLVGAHPQLSLVHAQRAYVDDAAQQPFAV